MGTPAQVHPQLLKMLQALAQMAGGAGKAVANRPGAQVQSPAQPGQAPQGMPLPTMGGAPSGQFAAPQATPPRPGGSSSQGSSEMMSKLSPNAAGVYQSVQDVSKLLQDWTSRQDQKQHVEAANIAQNLMQAMEATNSPDEKTRMSAIATVHDILNDKHSTKVLNKVYKGWLQKSKEAQKPGEPPDPAIAGFEKGLQNFQQGKSQKGPQMPSTMAGYRMPQAGPAQQAASTQAQTGAITAQQDLARAQRGEPTAAQKAEQEKFEAEKAKYTGEVQKAALDVQKAQFESQKAEGELKIKQTELQLAQKKGEQSQALDDVKLQTSKVNLDIANTRLAFARLGPKAKASGKEQLPPPGLLKPINASKQAEAYVESVLNSRGDGGFTQEDVQALTGMLQQAGASVLSKSLPGWFGRHSPSWAGGSGKSDVQSMLDSVRQYKAGLETTISERYPSWKGGAKPKSVADLQEDVGEEDDSDIVVDPEDMK